MRGVDNRYDMGYGIARQKRFDRAGKHGLTADCAILLRVVPAVAACTLTLAGCDDDDGN